MFGLSISVKGHTVLLSMRWSTRWCDLNPQNKNQVIRVKIHLIIRIPHWYSEHHPGD